MNIFKYCIAIACCIVIAFGSCKKDDVTPVLPSTISDLKTFSGPGEIGITWKRNEPVTFEYIKVTYLDKAKKKEMMRLASQYADTIIIPNTRAKYGEYSFTLQPFSVTDTGGEVYTVEGISGKAPADTTSHTKTKLELKVENLTSNDIQPGREPKYLLDGDPATFFHSRWQSPQHPVHYLEVNPDKPLQGGMMFYYSGRDNGNNYPTEIRIEASVDRSDWDIVKTISEGLPNPSGKIAEYTSPIIWFGNTKAYNHFRFWVTKTEDGRRWFVMSEFSMWEITPVVIDPEAPDEND